MSKQINLDGQIIKSDFFNTTPVSGFNWQNFNYLDKVYTEDCDEIDEIHVHYIRHTSQTVYLLTPPAALDCVAPAAV